MDNLIQRKYSNLDLQYLMCYFPFIRNKEKGIYFISYFNNSRYHVKFFLFLEQIKIGAELFLHKSGIMGTFSIIKCSTIHSGSPSKCWKSCKMSPMHLYWGIKGINLLCTLHLVTFISSKPKICEMEVNCQYTNRYTTHHLISASILNLNPTSTLTLVEFDMKISLNTTPPLPPKLTQL